MVFAGPHFKFACHDYGAKVQNNVVGGLCQSVRDDVVVFSARLPAAAVMSLIQLAKFNDLKPYSCLKNVMNRLPTQPNLQITDLLPHNCQPQSV